MQSRYDTTTQGSGTPIAPDAAASDQTAHGAVPDLDILLTAAEAFPYLEDLFLSARERVSGGFRIFDLATDLQSPEARAVGQTWFDLVAHTLARGVRLRLVLSDFDPIGGAALHELSWRSARALAAAGEYSGRPELLELRVHRHPAHVGWPLRAVLSPLARHNLRRVCAGINRLGPQRRAHFLECAPRLRNLVHVKDDGTIRPRPWVMPELFPCTHHQKLAVADGRRLYIGGLDLNNRRADSPDHTRAARRTWADLQLGLTGPIAAEAEAHLAAFMHETEGRRAPAPRGDLLRTLSRPRRGLGALRLGPQPLVSEIEGRTRDGVAAARTLIFLETQFLRDLDFARMLADRGRAVPDLTLICVLPAAPEEVAFMGETSLPHRFGEHLQARAVEMLQASFGDRATFVSPARPSGLPPDGSRGVLHGAPIVYVHTKASVFDTTLAVVSSANLNGRSHRWDTEAGVALSNPGQVEKLRGRLMRHWLPETPEPALLDPARAAAAWMDLARRNAETPPNDRAGFLLPYPVRAPRRFGRPIPFLPQELA